MSNLCEEGAFKSVKMRRQPLSVISNSSLDAKTSSGRVRKPPKRFIEEGGDKIVSLPNVKDKKVDCRICISNRYMNNKYNSISIPNCNTLDRLTFR